MSRPMVVIACMVGSSESWEHQQHPHPWHSCAGGGAVHSIMSGKGAGRNGLSVVSCELPRLIRIDSLCIDASPCFCRGAKAITSAALHTIAQDRSRYSA